MAAHLQDDGFHEIQLNGKQLVFLFMAATVVSVVIFLCGVLVGRGVRAERTASAEVASVAAAEPLPQPAPVAPSTTTAAASGSDPRAAAEPPPAADDLSYFNRLEKNSGAAEDLKAAAPKPAAPKPAAPTSAPDRTNKAERAERPAPEKSEKPAAVAARPDTAAVNAAQNQKQTAPVVLPPAAAKAVPSPAAESAAAAPSGSGYAVQVAAVNVRTDADAIAKRLTSKGYAAYVLASGSGTPQVFRVRVGKFPTRREAESIATKLQKEEQFKPWITR